MTALTDTPCFLPVTELVTKLASNELSCVELTESYLARIAKHNETLHAYISVYETDAMQAAQAADLARKAGHACGPLHGIPIAVKDIIDIQGRITTGGSKVWENRVSPVTATLVSRLLNAGMIILGKTHTVEFAMGSWGTNQHMGNPRNPWDMNIARCTGGSSAGSGAAVAAGLAPWAIGTDTGGSVRIPSAYCGLSGLKTTIGRVSCHGVLPLAATLDTPGPMCQTMNDAALLYDVLRGPDANDSLTLHQPNDPPFKPLENGLSNLTLARMPEAERDHCHSAVLAAYDEALDTLRANGATLVDLDWPFAFGDIGNQIGEIIGVEGYSVVGELVEDASKPVDDDVRPRIQLGRDISAHEYLRVLRIRERMKQQVTELMSGVDALLTPGVVSPALPIDEIDQNGTAAHFTRAVNYLDYCAAVVPAGLSDEGLPCSLQIICTSHQEHLALGIGHAYQQVTHWHKQRPML